MKPNQIIRLCLAAPLFFLSGCLTKEGSTTGPDASPAFKSSYSPVKREYWVSTETKFK